MHDLRAIYSRGRTICTCFGRVANELQWYTIKDTTCAVQRALTWYVTQVSPCGSRLLILILVLLMAQCNRCNAPLANDNSRSLSIHRLHCKKNKPMKYRQTAVRMSGKAAALLQKSRRCSLRDKVHPIIFHTML